VKNTGRQPGRSSPATLTPTHLGEFAVPDGPYTIKVKLDVTPGPDKAFSESSEIKVEAVCVGQFVVPANTNDKPTEVAVAPAVPPCQFQFLLIRPILLGKNPITAADLADVTDGQERKWTLTYSVPVNDPQKAWDQRKPLRGSHVFANGQTEWVTDMLGGDRPGSLTKLYFWNAKRQAVAADFPQAEQDKMKSQGKSQGEIDAFIKNWIEGRNDITVQVVAGYTPATTPASDSAKCAGS
jgi:hypothetical protein